MLLSNSQPSMSYSLILFSLQILIFTNNTSTIVQLYFMREVVHIQSEVGQQYEAGSKLIRRGRMKALLKVYRSQPKCEDAKVWPPRPVHRAIALMSVSAKKDVYLDPSSPRLKYMLLILNF